MIALRKNISKARGEQVLIQDIRYFFYITTRTDLTPAGVVACANERCDQENIIGQLKSGVNALRVPLYDLVSNWAYMVIAALAWNLKSWFAMMMHRKADRRDYIRMEFRRFLHGIILIPAMIIRRARTITVRLIGYQPSLRPALQRLEHHRTHPLRLTPPGRPDPGGRRASMRQPTAAPRRGGDQPCPDDETGHGERQKRALTPPATPVPPMTRSPDARPDTPTRPPNSPEHDHLDLGRDLAASSLN